MTFQSQGVCAPTVVGFIPVPSKYEVLVQDFSSVIGWQFVRVRGGAAFPDERRGLG